MIQLPRLLDSSMKEIARLEPASLSLNLNMAPLSTATLALPEGQPEVQTGAFVELFTPHGSAGIFRVQQAYHKVGGVMTLNLEHGLVTLSDGIIPGASEKPQTANVKTLLETILSHQSTWKLGKVEVPEDVTLAWGYDYSNLLESLLSVLDKLPSYMAVFDQTVTPWIIDIVAVSETPASECRLSRNINSLSVETDRSELCTRLYVPGLQAPLDADTIGKWGVVSRGLTGDEGLTEDELTAYGTRYLEEHKNPALTVSIDVFDLSKATGELMDTFHLGYMCRVCLPDYGQTINQRVVSISWPDMVADDENATLTLASSAETAADTLAGLIVDTTVQRRLIYKNGQELDRLVVRTIANENAINIITPELNTLAKEVNTQADKITQTAGDVEDLHATVTIEADGIREIIQKNDKTLAELKSTIDGLEHWVTDSDGNIAELTNTVRGMESKVESADGKVSILTNTADGLTNTVFGQGGELSQLKTRADEISAGVRDANGNIGSLSVKADSVTAKVKGVEGQVSQLAVTADGLNYTLSKHGQELSSIKALVDEISLTVRDTNGAMGQFVVQSDKIAGKLTDANGKLTALQELTEDRFRVVLGDIEVVEGDIKTITGSTLWQTRDSITGVVGKIEVDADGNVVVKQGSGLRVYENGTSVGVYNENNLTAGLLVQKINGGTTAKIKADKINLEGYVTMEAFEALQGEVDNLWSQQLIVDSLSANNVTAGEGDFDNLVFGTIAGKNSDAFVMDIVNTQLTTKTVKVVTDASFRATGEIAVRDADGNIVGTAITGGRVNYSTEEITYVVYAE